MYDQHIIFPGSVGNTREGDTVTGWRMGARLPYYRGQILSAVEDIGVTVDGVKVPRESVRFSVRGKTWTLDELETTYDERWEFGEVAEVLVLQPGGLAPGAHTVTASVQLRISYLPWSPVTNCTISATV
ncbi:C-glycoside deglycosidase beta subunit domain-containing protein [Pseudoduganella namucuonensis]|uniref:C-deglycosylation enzyme beta subunit n=1 Tax=Pseudoduganella namucuonensis TaxID=1035707 RepID=A0A1I7H117_9BURK|nr:DUF6379 domain-containing protein [Pseudoduganella namucuonensis]SFU54176.1 hypothetical protein SAMN05216552_1004238 [Pseudoduganella namucuonensis]